MASLAPEVDVPNRVPWRRTPKLDFLRAYGGKPLHVPCEVGSRRRAEHELEYAATRYLQFMLGWGSWWGWGLWCGSELWPECDVD